MFDLETDIHKAGSDPFMYDGGSMYEQHFYASCQPDDVILRASYDSISNDASAEGV